MYYPCSENKGADQLRGYREADLRLCFRLGKNPVFSRCGSFVKTSLQPRKITGTLTFVHCSHKKNLPMQYKEIFKVVENEIFCTKILIFFLFVFKTLIVGTRQNRLAEAVLTCTHNLCFGAKIRKIGIPLHTPVYYIKVEYKGVYITWLCFSDGKVNLALGCPHCARLFLGHAYK